MNVELKVHADEYLSAMGAVGLWRLYQFGLKHQLLDTTEGIQDRTDYLVVRPSFLEHVSKLFFLYFLDAYSVARRERKRLEAISSNFDLLCKTLKDSVKLQGDKIKKYFPERKENEELHQISEDIKRLKNKEQLTALQSLANRYLELLSVQEFDQKLTLNYVKSVLLQPLFGQVSFLNVSFNGTLDDHIQKMHEDYVVPVLNDLALQEQVDRAQDPASLLQAMEGIAAYQSWRRQLKKKTLSEMREFFKSLPRCMLFDEMFATHNFEEMVFSPLGVSTGNARNFSWNLMDNQPVPLSSWGKLVIFLGAAGLTAYYRNIGGDIRFFQGFVYVDGPIGDHIQANEHFKNLEYNESFDRVVSRLLSREEFKAKRQAANILFIEINADYRAKRTVLEYFSVPRHMVDYFASSHSKLDKIVHKEFRETFLRLAMNSLDPKGIMFSHIRQTIKDHRSPISDYMAVMERQKILWLKKGVKEMDVKKISALYSQGLAIRNEIIASSDERRKQEEGYVSGGDKQVASIAYRLLNAAKSGDRKLFLDTVIRLHLQAKKPVSNLFLNALHEQQMDFTTVAMAFITGLLGKSREETVEETDLVSEPVAN